MDDVPDELYFLADQFPPRSLRRYQLKAILEQYAIDVPKSYKKADLVQLFQHHVLSKKDQLIAEYHATHGTQDEPVVLTKRRTVQRENPNDQDKDLFSTHTKSSTFTVKEMSPDINTTEPETPREPTPELPDPVSEKPVYLEEEDDEYVFSGSDYSEDDYVEEEPVDTNEVEWLIRDTENAKRTRKEKTLAAVNQYWTAAQMLFRATYITLLLLALAAAVTITVARTRNGYCSTTITEEERGALSPLEKLAALPASCIPCPDHGVCADGALLCPGLYTRRRPLYNVFGLLPVADECIQDSAIGRAVARTEKRIKNVLARQQGQHVCDYATRFGNTEGLSMVRVKRDDIKHAVMERYLAESKLSPKMLEQVLYSAFASLASDPKIHYWEIDGEPYFGTEKTSFTTWCTIKMFFMQASPQVRQITVGILAGIPILSFAWYNYSYNRKTKRLTQAKVSQVIDMLKEQLEKHLADPENIERGFPVSQIRVKVTDVNKPGSVDEWVRIAKDVQKRPQVRRAFREVAGEPCEYWELAH